MDQNDTKPAIRAKAKSAPRSYYRGRSAATWRAALTPAAAAD